MCTSVPLWRTAECELDETETDPARWQPERDAELLASEDTHVYAELVLFGFVLSRVSHKEYSELSDGWRARIDRWFELKKCD